MKKFLTLLCMLSMVATSCHTSASAKEADAVKTQAVCKETPLKQSQEMIRAILKDLGETYTQVGGGGISSIKQTATRT
jgi:uncharacterized pyridoxal phosphate-containing UPF0001 family protein